MAGATKVIIMVELTGLGSDFTVINSKTLATVPVEHGGSGKYIIHATATTTAIQLSDIFPQLGLDKIFGIYIKAEVGTIYIMLNTSGTTTFGETTADLALLVGEAVYLPVNPDLTTANGMTIDAAAITDAFSITAFAKA